MDAERYKGVRLKGLDMAVQSRIINDDGSELVNTPLYNLTKQRVEHIEILEGVYDKECEEFKKAYEKNKVAYEQ